jgi:putative endonuclease
MINPSTSEKGLLGETIARQHLEKEGFRILRTNYRSEGAEVDIIAEEGEVLVFCEVKYRRTEEYGPPELALTSHKKAQVRRAALAYLAEEEIENRTCRFDVVALQQKGSRVDLRHWRNAF